MIEAASRLQWLWVYIDQGWYDGWNEVDELLADGSLSVEGYFV